MCTCAFADVVCYTTTLADCTTTVIILASALGGALVLCFCVTFCLCGCCCGKKGTKGCCTALVWLLCCPCMCLCSAIPKICRACMNVDDDGNDSESVDDLGEDGEGDGEGAARKKKNHCNSNNNNNKSKRSPKRNSVVPATKPGAHAGGSSSRPLPEWAAMVDPSSGDVCVRGGHCGAGDIFWFG